MSSSTLPKLTRSRNQVKHLTARAHPYFKYSVRLQIHISLQFLLQQSNGCQYVDTCAVSKHQSIWKTVSYLSKYFDIGQQYSKKVSVLQKAFYRYNRLIRKTFQFIRSVNILVFLEYILWKLRKSLIPEDLIPQQSSCVCVFRAFVLFMNYRIEGYLIYLLRNECQS